jgi:hypothetical protein
MLVFGVRSKLSLLVESHDWFMHGTFKTAPLLFEQLYTTHALTTIGTILCVYALLTNKQQATYIPY